MSNRIIITPTVFISPGPCKDYGVRVSDDYGSFFIDTWEEVSDRDPLDVLDKLFDEEENQEVSDLIEHIHLNKQGVNINCEYYDYEKIEKIVTWAWNRRFGRVNA